ncbi:MAG TPA: VOC family protein [Myxococcales bacterium]|jgi:predicted enzyme related to lactoylglutathione lyase
MKLSPVTVAVVVKNLKAARKFYTQKLGLKVLDDMEHWLTVGADKNGMRIHLCEMKPQEKGNTGILFAVDEKTDKAYAALKKKGVKFTVPPTQHEWGMECRFVDPDGNEFWLMGK